MPFSRIGVRVKVLALVITAALVPALLVGAASYYAAQSILLEKTRGQLATRTESVAYDIEAWAAERRQDVEIFANSFVVTDSLARVASGAPERAIRIREYLRQVQERFPLYQALLVVDASGRDVARAGAGVAPPRSPGSTREARILWLEGGGDQPVLYVEQPIRGVDEGSAGTLIAVSALQSLWNRVSSGLAVGGGELRLVTPTARATFTSRGGLPTWDRAASPRDEACAAAVPVISRYRTNRGTEVLAACRKAGALDLVVIQELDARAALASIRELRNRVLLIALVGAVLLAGLAYALVVRLIRPIEALIEGARAVSRGDYTHEVRVSSRDELGYLVSVFNDMKRALRATHGELEQKTRTDELTGLFNRRHLDTALEAELARARREKAPLGVLMLDLDHFKAFNDRFGHPEGDALLRIVAELLREQLRPTDTVARYGGEEFTVLLPHSPRAEAIRIAERIRRRLSELRVGTTQAAMTGSLGLASWPEDGDTAAELIAAADEADRVEARGLPADPDDAGVKNLRAELVEVRRTHAGRREAITAAKL
ncbi:MAG TPA: diguanylate cyclase, partial [Vicinamibacteria bacterium]|nr:diguanylate cyclase [Vicinamibacteria bacterium]